MQDTKLSEFSIEVLDFLLDDEYGLWEVKEILLGRGVDAIILEENAMSIVSDLMNRDLIDLYLVDAKEKKSEKVSTKLREAIVMNSMSWLPPVSLHDGTHYTVFANEKGVEVLKVLSQS